MAHATEIDPTDQDIREAARALEQLELGQGDLVRGLTLRRSHSVSGDHANVTVTVTESVGTCWLTSRTATAQSLCVVIAS